MELTIIIIGFALLSYILGSIPSAVWVGKIFYDTDVREHGSGNAGATNTFRVLGITAGVAVMLMDVLKGFAATRLAAWLPAVERDSFAYVNFQLLFGLLAVVGHLFPVFAGFKGGKGIATLFGMILAIHPLLALLLLGIFLVVLLLTRYVSLSSLIAALSFPLTLIFIFKREEPLFIAFGIVTSILVILTHQKNIRKLVQGTENRANLFGRNNR